MPTSGRLQRADALGPDSPIPNKLYFKIGEVAQLVGVQAHVLRYWEKEVPAIRPGKSASNQRRYRFKDVELFREIRRLLHDERYTLAGARRRLWGGGDSAESERPGALTAPRAAWGDGAQGASATLVAAGPGRPVEGAAEHAAGVVSALDERQRRELRRGLEELIRLAGEEP